METDDRVFLQLYNVSHGFNSSRQVELKILNNYYNIHLDIYIGEAGKRLHQLHGIYHGESYMLGGLYPSEWTSLRFCMPQGFHTLVFAHTVDYDSFDFGIGSISVNNEECRPDFREPGLVLLNYHS